MNIIKWGRQYVDYRMGFIGSAVMGGVVFYINYHATMVHYGSPDITGAVTAAMKQAVYTFFMGGFVMRLAERLATTIQNTVLALTLATLIPSGLTLILTYAMHTLKGTPMPFESTIPTFFAIVPGTLIWGIIRRRKVKMAAEKSGPLV
jgi:hypothetical protein